MSKSEDEKSLIGDSIFIKFTIENVKRNLNCTATTY